MSKIKELREYIKIHLLPLEIDGDILSTKEKDYYIVSDNSNVFTVELPKKYSEQNIEEYVYNFGGRWYIQKFGEEPTLKELKYIGEALQKLPTKSFLGVHSGYELMNGVGIYKEWVKKAKFLGVQSLGICERSSLSGVITFQGECKKNGIKSIIGMEVPIVNSKGKTYNIKLYCKNFQGWFNLLKFNTILNMDLKTHVEEEFLESNITGLYVIVDPKTTDFEHCPSFSDYFQLDTVQYVNQDTDIWYLDNLEKYILSKEIRPIAIYDAYYLEKDDVYTREALWDISKVYDHKTVNQFFKNKDQYASELISMFKEGNNSWIKLFKEAVSNETIVSEGCNFTYDTTTRHLPKYRMTPEESEQFSSSEQLFMHLITKGFKERNLKNPQKYIDRLKVEIDVLRKGDVIDYFLSLYDIIKFAKKENILTGIGRGSAGGSLIAYLLGIIRVDPLDFDLLFERFLNPGRMGVWEDRPLYSLELEDGSTIELQEGELVRINRDGVEMVVQIHEVQENDDILKY
jgi:DNA polymerase-3 subunit alpha